MAFHRRMKTTAERRANHVAEVDEDVLEHAVSYRARTLRDAWDDVPRSMTRSWKATRRNRWR